MKRHLLIPVGLLSCATSMAQLNCADLSITHLQWTTFSDTLIEAKVQNSGLDCGDYPSLDLVYNGTVIAHGVVEFFCIPTDGQPMTMRAVPGEQVPDGPFNAAVEVWTGFHTVLACSIPLVAELCPAQCAVVHPVINQPPSHIGQSFQWSITDADNVVLHQGEVTTTQVNNMIPDNICLAPGNYTFGVFNPWVQGDSVSFWLQDDLGLMSAYAIYSVAQSVDVTVLPACVEGSNGITTATAPQFSARVIDRVLEVRSGDGRALGDVELLDMKGSLCLRKTTASATVELNVSGLASGVYMCALRQGDVPWHTRVVVP